MSSTVMSPRSSDPRRILVVQQLHSGHRLMYVRLLVQEIIEEGGVALVAVSEEAQSSKEFVLHLAPISKQITVVVPLRFRHGDLEQLADRLRADQTVLLEADAFRADIALKGWRSGACSLLIMRPESQKTKARDLPFLRSLSKRILVRLASQRSNVSVFTLVSGSTASPGRSEVRDPIVITGNRDDHDRIGRIAGLSGARKWFGLVGAINARKNPMMVLSAAESALDSDDGLLIAGKIDTTVDRVEFDKRVRALEARGVRVLILDKLLEDLELDGLIANLHCVVLAHSNEGSSGILGRAEALGTSVLAAGARSLLRDIESVPGGLWVPLTETDLVFGLRRMKIDKSPEQNPPKGQKADGLVRLLENASSR